jgi:hypothetical protein
MSEIENQFKNALISFLDELISQFPQEGDLVIFRIFLKDRIPITNILNFFVHKIVPLKQMIVDRNEDFFMNHCNLFDAINSDKKDKLNHFKKLWRSGSLDDDDKRVVWEWFDSFVFLSEKYQKSLIKTK